MKKLEIQIFMRQCNPLKFINNMTEFYIVVFKEFASRRNVVEEIFY